MVTVKRIKHIDVKKRTLKGIETAILGVAEQGVTEAVLALTAIDTGDLKRSIAAEQKSKISAIFGSNIEYAPYIELGTYKMEAQPYLRPAADILKKTGSRIFAKILKGVLHHG